MCQLIAAVSNPTEQPSRPTDKKRPIILWGNVAFFDHRILAVLGLIWWFTSVEFSWAPIIAYIVLHCDRPGHHRGLPPTVQPPQLQGQQHRQGGAQHPRSSDLREQRCRVVLDHRRHHRLVDMQATTSTTPTADSCTRTSRYVSAASSTAACNGVDPEGSRRSSRHQPPDHQHVFNLLAAAAGRHDRRHLVDDALGLGLVRVVFVQHTTSLINTVYIPNQLTG